MTDADLYSAGRKRDGAFFEIQLERAPHTRERIGGAPPELFLVPAFSGIRDRAAERNWLAVGDAARSYDPLSGLGLCTSMSMAMDAARSIVSYLAGDPSGLATYDGRNRQAYDQYVESYVSHYGLEQRWPDSDFWRRRHSMGHTAPSVAVIAQADSPFERAVHDRAIHEYERQPDQRED